MRAPTLLLALLALPALLPGAGAQTPIQPVTGAYEDVYVVMGRAVDSRGEPASGAELTLTLSQPGVRAEPLRATANCKGDFITSFNLRKATAEGSVTITLHGRGNASGATVTERFDPFFRRTDALVRLPGPWEYRCSEKEDVWPVALTVTGRIVNRTDPWEKDGVTYDGRPYSGQARLRFLAPDGTVSCPPPANGAPGVCDFLYVDERGDFRYTFTFGGPVEAKGTMTVTLGGQTWSADVDPVTRQAVLLIEATGRGVPVPPAETPGPGPLLLAFAAVAAALLARRRART